MRNDDVTVPFMDLRAQQRPLRASLIEVFSKAVDEAAFVGGASLAKFEEAFAQASGCRVAVGVANGTDALRLALIALGVRPGDAVVTVPNTFIATTEAITQAGARIELVDVDRESCLIDPEALERHLASRTCAERLACVIPVHLYGQCADVGAIRLLVKGSGTRVLEDAAQAHGASFDGRLAGCLGDAACFSFYPAKNLGACGEAGAVTTDDEDIADIVRLLRDHGQAEKNVHRMEGFNSRMDAIQAGILRLKLDHLASWNERRRAIADEYDAAFGPVEGVHPIRIRNGNVPNRHLYVVHVDDREDLRNYLAARGVGTGLHYPIPIHLQECYRGLGYGEGSFPNAERSARCCLSLPNFPEMTRHQVRRVIEVVSEWACER